MPILWLLVACTRSEPEPEGCEPADEAPVEAVTTLTRRLEGAPREATPLELNPVWPEGLVAAEELGLGVISEAPGEARLLRDELAPGHGAPDRRSLALFLHHTDAQLADVESPTRMAGADAVGPTQSAARPQELYAIHALDAQIRTANALSAFARIDFAIATGDNADSTQENELRWFAAVFDGTPVRPDAGTPGSQLDEDCHDPVAEFTPTGADFPYYVVAGNHDVLVQGNFLPEPWTDEVVGADAPLGTRDLSQPGAPLVYVTEADPGRHLLDRGDIAAVMLDSPSVPGPEGHGFTDANVAEGTVNWVARPVEGAPLVVISVDANAPGPGDAELTLAERDGWLVPALEAAEADGDLVILTSHYALGSVKMEGGGRMADLIAGYPNVVLVVAGHSHDNRILAYGDPDDAGAFWQIETSSSNDWPQQGRIVELVVNGDGTLSIFTTVFDHASAPGSMGARARELALIDLQSGWRLYDGSGAPEDRNTELVQRLPDGFVWTGGAAGIRSEALP